MSTENPFKQLVSDFEAGLRKAGPEGEAEAITAREKLDALTKGLSKFNLARIDDALTKDALGGPLNYSTRRWMIARIRCSEKRSHDPMKQEKCPACGTCLLLGSKSVAEFALKLEIRPATRMKPEDIDVVDFVQRALERQEITPGIHHAAMNLLETMLEKFPRLPLPSCSTSDDEGGVFLGITWGTVKADDCPYVHVELHENGIVEIYAPDIRPPVIEEGRFSAGRVRELLEPGLSSFSRGG